uniref:Uncharacterized protein n=1 Tax=Ignisphaera aggregans TaxID=334771 RepID=A0A7C4BB35_9CREN
MEKKEIVVEEDSQVFIIRPVNGAFSSDDVSVALKAIKKFLKGELNDDSKHVQSSQKGNGRLHNDNNGNGYSPWLLAWLAEVNGYRDGSHLLRAMAKALLNPNQL